MANLLSGKPAMQALVEKLSARCEVLKAKGLQPQLAVVRVGDDPAAANYEESIRRRADMVGVSLKSVTLAESASKEELISAIEDINADTATHGVLIYLPFPGVLHGCEDEVCSHLAPEKDVDGITDGSAAAMYLGRKGGYAPCTAEACMRLLEHYGVEFKGKTACVVGRSAVIGKPAAMLLLQRHATVTIAHSRTRDLASVTSQADILIAAAGCASLITGKHVKPGAAVVDVGANWQDGKMVGDVIFDEAEPVAGLISPVPGGVGMVTSSVLMEHVIDAAEKTV